MGGGERGEASMGAPRFSHSLEWEHSDRTKLQRECPDVTKFYIQNNQWIKYVKQGHRTHIEVSHTESNILQTIPEWKHYISIHPLFNQCLPELYLYNHYSF